MVRYCAWLTAGVVAALSIGACNLPATRTAPSNLPPPASPASNSSPPAVSFASPSFTPAEFAAACFQGDAERCYTTGAGYANGMASSGLSFPKDVGKAALFFERACSLGNADGCQALGTAAEMGAGVPKDVKRAYRLFIESCDKGASLGCFYAAMLQLKGAGAPALRGPVMTLLSRACDLGQPQGCRIVAEEPPNAPATGAAGFGLDLPIGDAQRACVAAGRQFRALQNVPRAFECSGAPIDVGFDAAVELRWCGSSQMLCLITIRHDSRSLDPNVWLRQYSAIRDRLTAKYGQAGIGQFKLPKECEATLGACLTEGRAKIDTFWKWILGPDVFLTVVPTKAGADIKIIYASSAWSQDEPQRDGL
jgi:uncharacterized protein